MGIAAVPALPSLLEAAKKDEDEDTQASAFWAVRELQALARLADVLLLDLAGAAGSVPTFPAREQEAPPLGTALPEDTLQVIEVSERYRLAWIELWEPLVLDGVAIHSLNAFLYGLRIRDPKQQEEVVSAGRPSPVGGRSTVYWRGKEIDRFSDEYQRLLDRAFEALYATNEVAKRALLATGDAVLVHTKRGTNPETTLLTRSELCLRLIRIRGRLRRTAGPEG
jgi:hypothetical protein